MIPQGQILPDSDFGRALTVLARESEVIVEIGTWYGEGSTRCLANGLIRPTQSLHTIEANPDVSAAAAARYNDPRIHFLVGTITNTFQPSVPVILDQLPSAIDLLLIDGGDYEADLEWDILSPHSTIIALDDTNEIKNSSNFARMLSSGWTLLHHCPAQRLGWAIFKKP